MEEDIKVGVDMEPTDKPVEGNQDDKAPESETPPVEKHTVFGKIDQKILSRREARAKKKAAKQPINKTKKAAIIGGGIALGLGILGAVGKAALNAAEKYADEPEADASQDGYPTEDLPEEATEVEVETQETIEEET